MSYRDDNLFLRTETVGMSKLGSSLGKDTQLWSAQIKTTFNKENSPIIRAGGKPFLNFTYKDLPAGTAVGGITVTVGGRILLFPVVVKDNELSPFDNFYDQMDKEWHFMTDKVMNSLVNNGTHYSGLTSNVPSDAVNMSIDSDVTQPGWRNPIPGQSKTAGRIPGVPDATGPRGRGAGPGGGRADGSGLDSKAMDVAAEMHCETFNLDAIRQNKSIRVRYDPKRRRVYTYGEKKGVPSAYWDVLPGNGDFNDAAIRLKKFTSKKTASLDMSRMKDIAVYLDANPAVLFSMEPKVAHFVKIYSQAAMHADDMLKEASVKQRYPDFSIEGDSALITKKDINLYEIKVAALGDSGVFKAQTNSDGVRTLAGGFGKNAEKILDEVDDAGSSAIARGVAAPSRIISSATDIDPRQRRGHIGSAGTFTVTLDNGQRDTGVVLPIVDWQGNETYNYLFSSPDNYLISQHITGARAPMNNVLPKAPFSSGAKGVFVKESEGLYFSTWPIVIEEIWSSPEASNQIKAVDTRNMTKLNIVITDAVKVPTRIDPDISPEIIEHGRQNIYIPNNMKFSPLPDPGDQAKLAMSIGGAVAKEEALFERQNPGLGLYEITKKAGVDAPFIIFEKKAALRRTSGGHDEHIPVRSMGNATYVDFILKTAGLDIGMKILSDMVDGERLTVFTPGARTDHDDIMRKVASVELEKRVKRTSSEIKPLGPGMIIKLANAAVRANMGDLARVTEKCEMPGLVKTASNDEDESVNKILGLNFLGEENVDYFIDKLDTIKDAEDVLTRLLVVSRISDLGINPDDVKDALRGLSATKEKFEDVKRLRLAW